jgi:serine/threonine protein phosphatase PrpC
LAEPTPLRALPLLVNEAEMQSVDSLRFLNWQVAFFSVGSPAKTTVNEDSAAVLPFDDSSGVLVVADGMGGHAAGEVASRLAIQHLADSLAQAATDGGLLRTGIINGLEAANKAIMEQANGSGTTLSIVELSNEGARPYHVGDSMILLVGNRGKLKMETTAHSPVGFGLAAGLLDSEEASHHEERHVVLNAVGNKSMRIDIGPTRPMAQRDTLLVASDGLSDNVSVDEIIETIRKGPLARSLTTLTARCREQMSQSENGKPDDLTVLALRAATS